jgi:hypothetical protein
MARTKASNGAARDGAIRCGPERAMTASINFPSAGSARASWRSTFGFDSEAFSVAALIAGPAFEEFARPLHR